MTITIEEINCIIGPSKAWFFPLNSIKILKIRCGCSKSCHECVIIYIGGGLLSRSCRFSDVRRVAPPTIWVQECTNDVITLLGSIIF